MQRIIIYIALIIINLCSCTNSQEYKRLKSEFSDLSYNENYKSFDSIYSSIPNYSDISNSINAYNAIFDSQLLFEIQNLELIDSYKNLCSLLGVYIADLGYARHFEESQQCKEILSKISYICKKLGIEQDELKNNTIILEENLHNHDFIFQHIDSLISSKDNFISDKEKYSISAVILSGFWIESTYIGIMSEKNLEKNESRENSLKSHFKILNQINKLLDCLDDKNTLHSLKSKLQKVEIEGYKNENLPSQISCLRKTLATSK